MAQSAGRYHDGKTAKQRDVTISLESTALRILSSDDDRTAPLDAWPLSELHRIDADSAAGPVRLKRGEAGTARLTIDDAQFAAALFRDAPHLVQRPGWHRWVMSTMACGAVLLFLLFAVPQLSAWIAPWVPVSWEEDIRDVSISAVMAAFGGGEFCTGEAGTAALESLFSRLTATVESDYDIRVRVSSHELINALATPGGEVIIFRGLIEFAQTPDEVAAVLSHELGHLVRRHPTQALVRALSFDLMLDFVIGGFALSGLGQIALTLSYSRDAEREADAVGGKMLADAGFRPAVLADFFRRLEEKQGALPAAFRYLSTHPTVAERIDRADKSGGGGPAMLAEAWDSLQRICD